MAKRPQKRSGELTTPQLQQPQFQVQARPVDTAIRPNVAGAPAKPLMESDPAKPDFQRADDLNRLGKSLMGLSTTVNSLIKLESIRTDEAQEDALRVMAETDKTLAELVEEGKLTGVTPAHQRGYARASSTQELLKMEQEYLAGEAQMRTEEGAVDPEYAERFLRKKQDEIRRRLSKTGIHQGHFNKAFNKGFAELLNTVNRRHHAWAGGELQTRTASDVSAELLRIASTIKLDGTDGQKNRFIDEVTELIDGRAEGRLTQRAAHLVVGQAAVDLQISHPELKEAMDLVLDDVGIGPTAPSRMGGARLGRAGRLGKVSEVKNYRSKKNPQILSGQSQRRTQVAKAEFGDFQQRIEGQVLELARDELGANPRTTAASLIESSGESTRFGFAASVIASNPELKEYYDKGDLRATVDENGDVLFVNTATNTEYVLKVDDVLKQAVEQKRTEKIESGSNIKGRTLPGVRAATSLELGILDPDSKDVIESGMSLLSRSSAELARRINELGGDVEGVRNDPAFAPFMAGYAEYSAYDDLQMAGEISSKSGLGDAGFIYEIFQHMTTLEGHTEEGAFKAIVEAIDRVRTDGGIETDGLSATIERQIPIDERDKLTPEIKQLAKMYLFMSANASSQSIDGNQARITAAVQFAEKIIDNEYLDMGGTRIKQSSLLSRTEDTLGAGSDFQFMQEVLGEKDGARSMVGRGFNENSAILTELFGEEFVAENAPDGQMAVSRFEPVDPNVLSHFYVYQASDGLSGERQVRHPTRADGSFTRAELLDIGGYVSPEEEAKIAERQQVKVETLERNRPRTLIKLLSESEVGQEIVAPFFAVTAFTTPPGREFGYGMDRSTTLVPQNMLLSEEPALADLIDKDPWMMYFLSPDGERVFDKISPDEATGLEEHHMTFSRTQSMRRQVGRGAIPGKLSRAFSDPKVLLAYQNLTDEEKATIPDLAWMGDLNQEVPSRFRLREEGFFEGTIFSRRTRERILDSITDFGIDLGGGFGRYDVLTAARTGEGEERHVLLARLLQASPEGRAYLNAVKNNRYYVGDLTRAAGLETMEAAEMFLKEFSDEQREALGRRFDFYYDPRFIVMQEQRENERIADKVEAEARKAASEIAEDMAK